MPPRGSWLQQKSILYQEAKRLASLLNIPPPIWRSSTSIQLRRFLTVNASQERFIQRREQIQQVQRRQRVERRQRRRLPISLSRQIRINRRATGQIFPTELRHLDMMSNSHLYRNYFRARPFNQFEIAVPYSITFDHSNVDNWTQVRDFLSRRMLDNTDYTIHYYRFSGNNSGKFENRENFSNQEFLENSRRNPTSFIINKDSSRKKWISLGQKFHKFGVADQYDDYMRMQFYIPGRGFYAEEVEDVPLVLDPFQDIVFRFIPVVQQNAPLRNQRNGIINCACKVVLDTLKKHKQTDRVKRRIKKVNEINAEYLESGIDENGLQLLANKSDIKLIIKDKIGEVWNEFIPQSKGNHMKLLLVSRNNHIEEIYDSDDEEEASEMIGLDPDRNPDSMRKLESIPKNSVQTDWFDTNEPIIEFANDYESTGKYGTAIISKGNLVAYITDIDIYKTKFHQYEIYPECFTSGGVGKAKFIEQHPEFKHGITDEDPFYQLLMDADRSGFYFKNGEGKVKYDQNQAYKSFRTSEIFQGFPNLEAIFEVDSLFSDFISVAQTANHGLLYIEYETLTLHDFVSRNTLVYEGSGWYPIEIVKANYKTYGINPLVKQYAYASETFDIDFTDFTNDQFRTFLGKCISKSFDDVWKTTSYDEFMRARYILKDRIVKISQTNAMYEIVFTSNKKPWNMPVISAYVKAHQKFNIFNQYNRIISAGYHVNAISVDSIEISRSPVCVANGDFRCDHLFNMNQWKLEAINRSPMGDPFVIKREEVKPTMTGLPLFNEVLGTSNLLPKYLHYSGAGGNGKTETIINLAKAYKKAMFIAPTTSAVKNLLDRAKQLGIKIEADTYHRVFGFGCEDRFPRNKYNKYFLDECSMVSAPVLKQMIAKVPSLILSGDFWQLPCVNEKPIYDNWTDEKSNEYDKFEVRELTTNWRQKSDPEFYDLCNKLRKKLTRHDAMKLLEILNTRIITSSIPDRSTLDDIQICGINSQVDEINKSYEIGVGCKVICNIKCHDLEKKMVPNGSIGIITSLSPFSVQWEDSSISTFKCIGKQRFTIAYGLTVHKCQGRTLKRNVIINPTRFFEKNHLYVALTRATCFNNIFLTKKMSFDMFCKTVFVHIIS